MRLPFRRSPHAALRAYGAPRASVPALSQRVWEVEVILFPLHPMMREALRSWLLQPTTLRLWQSPDTFAARRFPISEEETEDGTRPVASRLLLHELKVIRQTLDLPAEALSGLARNGLLTVHGIRLRQLEHWLWPFFAAREITRLIDYGWR